MKPIKFESSDSPGSSACPGNASPSKRNPKSGTRISHTKSRRGCVTCKRRKVKCDEQRPSCFNCTRLREECKYLLTPNKKPPHPRPEPPSAGISGTSGINLIDLELFYVYSTSTCSTLSLSSTMREFWRITVPRVAIENRYLMGEILALSALHLAHHRPIQRHHYLSIALAHHQAASQQAMGLLKNVNKENVTGLFIFSALTIMISMAIPERSPFHNISREESRFEDWIYLIQGPKELRNTLGEDYPHSSLTPLFKFTSERWNLHYSTHCAGARNNDMFCELQNLVCVSVDDTEKLDIFVERINSLRSAACHVVDWEATDVFFWLYGCIDGFLPLVKARNQEAWVILAYFCVMLKKAETQWWLQGWANCMMREIYEQLNDEHKHWFIRPAEEIGWIAP